MSKITTYLAMNAQIVGILRTSDQAPLLYAAQYIEELQAENVRLKARCDSCQRELTNQLVCRMGNSHLWICTMCLQTSESILEITHTSDCILCEEIRESGES